LNLAAIVDAVGDRVEVHDADMRELPFDDGAFDPFDIIWLDPPYDASDAEVTGVLAAAGEALTPDGLAVLERARRRPAADEAGRLGRSRDVVSGHSALTFYEVKRQKEEGKS